MKEIKLDKSERDILTAYESGELKSVMTPTSEPPRESRRPVGLSHAALHDRLLSS